MKPSHGPEFYLIDAEQCVEVGWQRDLGKSKENDTYTNERVMG